MLLGDPSAKKLRSRAPEPWTYLQNAPHPPSFSTRNQPFQHLHESAFHYLKSLPGSAGGQKAAYFAYPLNFEDGLWTIPAQVTKNKKVDHIVPLSAWALEWINKCKNNSPFVFPSYGNSGHIDWFTTINEKIAEGCKFDFTPHDLRRTAATKMAEHLKIDDTTIDRIQNHISAVPKVRRVYNRYDRLPEMRTALERWGAKLEQIVKQKPAKVVAMR